MRINVAVPEAHVDKPVLDAALESVTRLNESLLQRGEVPPFDHALHVHGIKWKPEPPGAEHFDHAKTVMERLWGDCDDLAPWKAASLRASGEDPGARAVVKKSGPKRWHAIVERSDGTFTDPSRDAGMGQPVHGVGAAALPLMMLDPYAVVGGAYILRPQIAVRPVRDAFQSRVDIPWHWRERMMTEKPSATDLAMATLHTAPVASTALVGALQGACALGEAAGGAHPDDIDRLCAISDACQGAEYEDLLAIYGPEHADAAAQAVVGIFGGLGRMFKRIAAPIASVVKTVAPFASKALQFVPGVGPVASTALDLVTNPKLFTNPSALLSRAASFVPGVGPMASSAIDLASRFIPSGGAPRPPPPAMPMHFPPRPPMPPPQYYQQQQRPPMPYGYAAPQYQQQRPPMPYGYAAPQYYQQRPPMPYGYAPQRPPPQRTYSFPQGQFPSSFIFR